MPASANLSEIRIFFMELLAEGLPVKNAQFNRFAIITVLQEMNKASFMMLRRELPMKIQSVTTLIDFVG